MGVSSLKEEQYILFEYFTADWRTGELKPTASSTDMNTAK
jgi:hypothetical protein